MHANGTDERVRIGMRMIVHRSQHRHPWPGDAQTGVTEHLLDPQRCSHVRQSCPFSGTSQELQGNNLE
jgi:hypothetical protein